MSFMSSYAYKEMFEPSMLAGLTLKNRFIKSATYEGMYKNGLPTSQLIDHHVSLVKGGVGLTTVSYGAISNDARTFSNQMVLNEGSLQVLAKLTHSIHKHGGKVSIQLTHCGFFTKEKRTSLPLSPSKTFNKYGLLNGVPFSKAMKIGDMNTIIRDFCTAASLAKNAGFDAVELHMGHGYLLSQFLSPRTNRRKDDYGGEITDRARYPLQVFEAIKNSVGPSFPVLVKLNLHDGFKGGFDLEDCVYVCEQLEKRNCDAVILSGGFTSISPFYLMRGGIPLKGMIRNGESLTEKITMSLFGPFIVKKYPFEPNFFLNMAKIVRDKVRLPLAYLGGVDSRQGIETVADCGFDFIALARPLIHDPDFLMKIKSGEIEKTGCNRCNECVVEMDRGGIRCVLN